LSCQPFTALFDIGRNSIDGRGLDSYLNWLQLTIELCPNLIIFHDAQTDLSSISGGTKILIDTSKLKTFGYLPYLEELFQEYRPKAYGDITFNLPKYSLIQYSKFELASILLVKFPAESYLWLDAGISRFLKNQISSSRIEDNASKLLKKGFDLMVEIDVKNNFLLHGLRIEKSDVGTCRRVISGTSFWLNSKSIFRLNGLIEETLNSWKDQRVWDNEQVLLRNILPNYILRVNYRRQLISPTGGVARWFGKKHYLFLAFPNRLIEWFMRK